MFAENRKNAVKVHHQVPDMEAQQNEDTRENQQKNQRRKQHDE